MHRTMLTTPLYDAVLGTYGVQMYVLYTVLRVLVVNAPQIRAGIT